VFFITVVVDWRIMCRLYIP